MIDPIFTGTVQNARLTLNQREMFDKYLHTLSGEVQVIVRKPRKPRSLAENGYYHGCVLKIISDTSGQSVKAIHDFLRHEFLVDVTAKIKVAKSTSDLSTVEMEEYLAKIRMWASEFLNCQIPLPNQIDLY